MISKSLALPAKGLQEAFAGEGGRRGRDAAAVAATASRSRAATKLAMQVGLRVGATVCDAHEVFVLLESQREVAAAFGCGGGGGSALFRRRRGAVVVSRLPCWRSMVRHALARASPPDPTTPLPQHPSGPGGQQARAAYRVGLESRLMSRRLVLIFAALLAALALVSGPPSPPLLPHPKNVPLHVRRGTEVLLQHDVVGRVAPRARRGTGCCSRSVTQRRAAAAGGR